MEKNIHPDWHLKLSFDLTKKKSQNKFGLIAASIMDQVRILEDTPHFPLSPFQWYYKTHFAGIISSKPNGGGGYMGAGVGGYKNERYLIN